MYCVGSCKQKTWRGAATHSMRCGVVLSHARTRMLREVSDACNWVLRCGFRRENARKRFSARLTGIIAARPPQRIHALVEASYCAHTFDRAQPLSGDGNSSSSSTVAARAGGLCFNLHINMHVHISGLPGELFTRVSDVTESRCRSCARTLCNVYTNTNVVSRIFRVWME